MKRTGPGVLVVAGILGLAAGFVTDQVLTGGGRSTFTPSLMLPVLLVALGVIVVALAMPIARAIRGATTRPIDPFRALRIAMLAKASSILGAGVGGFGLGLATFVLTRPVTPSVGSVTAVLLAAVSGALLVAAGLVAERLCTIRKDDDDEPPAAREDTTPSHH